MSTSEIVVVTNSLSGGGAERAMNILANQLHKQGWKVTVVSINSGVADFVKLNCHHINLGRDKKLNLWSTVMSFVHFVSSIAILKPRFLILNCDLPEFFGAMLPWKLKHLIVVEHGRPWGKREFLGKIVRRLLGLRNARWISVSPHVKIWPKNLIPDKVISNPVVVNSSPRYSFVKNQRLKRLMFVGRLEREDKRAHWVREIGESMSLQMQFIGHGRLYEEWSAAPGRKSNLIDLLGYVEDPWQYYELGDLVIVPSEREGDGLVVVEAIMRGIPILLANIEAFRRFGFPPKHYCETVKDFQKTIEEFSLSIEQLTVDRVSTNRLSQERNPEWVGHSWHEYLKCLDLADERA